MVVWAEQAWPPPVVPPDVPPAVVPPDVPPAVVPPDVPPAVVPPDVPPAVVPPADPKFHEILEYMEWISDQYPHKFRVDGNEIAVESY